MMMKKFNKVETQGLENINLDLKYDLEEDSLNLTDGRG